MEILDSGAPVESTRAHIVSKIDAYLLSTGTAAWALGLASVYCSKTVARLRKGNVGLKMISSVEDFMSPHPDGVRLNRLGKPLQAPTKGGVA